MRVNGTKVWPLTDDPKHVCVKCRQSAVYHWRGDCWCRECLAVLVQVFDRLTDGKVSSAPSKQWWE